MLIERIYEQLRNDRLCSSAYEFSELFLGRSASYYSMLKARKTEPSVEVLLTLETALREKAESFSSNRYPFFVRTRHHLLTMSEDVSSYRTKLTADNLCRRVAELHA